MQTFHFLLGDDFCVFIRKKRRILLSALGTTGGISYAPGRYVDAAVAVREMQRLRAEGYEERRGDRGSVRLLVLGLALVLWCMLRVTPAGTGFTS